MVSYSNVHTVGQYSQKVLSQEIAIFLLGTEQNHPYFTIFMEGLKMGETLEGL